MIKQKANVNVKNQKAVRRLLVLTAIALVGGGFACWGAAIGFGVLRDIWLEQFRVQDAAIDVVVTYSPTPEDPNEAKSKIDTIKYIFGLMTNGVNLATIPYHELRAKALVKYPQIQSISVKRQLPRRVTIEVKERDAAVHIVSGKGQKNTGLVADYDGVVFYNYKAPPQLPLVREPAEARHAPGQRLEGHAYAALQLVHVLADAAEGKSDAVELVSLRVREINTSKKDYLLVTLEDYSTAEIAWDRMGEDSEVAQKSLCRQLVRLSQAIATHLTPRSTRWIATEYEKGGRVYAADPARLGER